MSKDQKDQSGKPPQQPSKEPLVRKDSNDKPRHREGGMVHDHSIQKPKEQSVTDWQKPPRPKGK